MSKVAPKVMATHREIGRVWCFQNDQSPGLEYARSLLNQRQQIISREVLRHVKCSDHRERPGRETCQIFQGIGLDSIEALMPAILHRTKAGINAHCGTSFVLRQRKPFSPSTANIQPWPLLHI